MNLPISKDSTTGLVIAGLLGLLFGVLLNKGRVTQYNVIVNFFRLKDFTVMKVMLTAIVVGGIGVYVMMSMGVLDKYSVKSANLLGVTLGSAIFGIGMAIYGYCPGTGIAAMAVGRLDALMGVFGMIAGGIAYALSYESINSTILSVGKMGKIRLPEVTSIPAPVFLAILVAGALGLFYWLEKKHEPKTVDED